MAALDTPLAGCDCDGQAQQPKPEQHMVTRDSDSSGIRVWEEPQGKPLRPAGVIEWMVHEGDDDAYHQKFNIHLSHTVDPFYPFLPPTPPLPFW